METRNFHRLNPSCKHAKDRHKQWLTKFLTFEFFPDILIFNPRNVLNVLAKTIGLFLVGNTKFSTFESLFICRKHAEGGHKQRLTKFTTFESFNEILVFNPRNVWNDLWKKNLGYLTNFFLVYLPQTCKRRTQTTAYEIYNVWILLRYLSFQSEKYLRCRWKTITNFG